jgi:hypothetical protein
LRGNIGGNLRGNRAGIVPVCIDGRKDKTASAYRSRVISSNAQNQQDLCIMLQEMLFPS